MANRIAGITIEIGGDTTKLQTALKDVDKSLKTTQGGLKDINKLLKLDPTNVNLLKQKQEYLTKAIGDTEEKLKTEKEALRQMKESNTTGEVTEQQKALEREIADTETQLKALKKEYKDFGSVASQQLKAVGEKMQKVGDKTTEVGKDLSKKVTAPIAAGFGAAIKTTADFESQMSKVQAITGSTGEDMDTLNKKAREMGAKTKFSATEAGQAMEYMGMAGWKTTDIVDGLDGIMNLAAASGEELGTTSDIVTDALTAFGLEAKDAGHFADVLAAASTNSNTNVSMLGESFKYVAPVAGAMGYSVEDVTTALGLMANNGIKASSAGTSLRTLLTNMAKPTDAMARSMDELGISLDDGNGNMKSFGEVMKDLRKGFGQTKIPADELEKGLANLEEQFENGEITEKKYNKEVEALMTKAYGAEGALKAQTAATLAGKTGMSGLLAIVNSSDEDFEKLSKAIKTSSDETDGYNGQAEKMAGVMNDNLNGQLTILMSQIQELAISIGESLLPTVKDIVGKIQDAVDWLNGLDKSQKDMIIKIGLVVAAIGPLLVVVGTVISSIGTIVGAVGGLIGLMSGGGGVVAAAGAVKTAIGGIVAAIGTAGSGLIASISALLPVIAPFLIGGAVIAGIVAAVVLIVKNWDKIKAAAKKLWEGVKKTWENIKTKTAEVFKNVAETAKQKFNDAKTAVTTAANNIKTEVSSRFNEAKTAVSTAVSNIASNVKEKLSSAASTAKEKASNIKSKISTGFSDAATAVKTKAGEISDSIKDKAGKAIDDFNAKVGGVADKVKNGLYNAKVQAWNIGYEFARNLQSGAGNAVDNFLKKIKSISDTVKNALQKAKEKASKFTWTIPKPKMPHIKLEYDETTIFGKTYKYPTGFKTEWYKRAYQNPVMFTRPTVLQTPYGQKGFGDGRGGEIVLSDAKLRQIAGSGEQNITFNIYGGNGQSVNAIADAVQNRMIALQRQREAAGLA